MNKRDRLLNTLTGKKADRVPISTYELCGHNSKSYENIEPSYKNLMDFIREKTDSITMWNPNSSENLAMSSYHVDIIKNTKKEDDITITQYSVETPLSTLNSQTRVTDGIYTTWRTEHWCKNINDVDAYMSIPYQQPKYDYSDLTRVKKELGDHGIIMGSISDPACYAMEMMEFGEATVWALTQEDHFKKTMYEIHKRNMLNLECMLKSGVLDMYRICGPEYITPPYLPPSMFEKYVFPFIKEMTELIQSYGSLSRIHSHGKIAKVLDMIIDTSADALDPVEAPPDGDISLSDVVDKIDGRMTVIGNLQLKLLEHGKACEVRDEVIKCMEAAKHSGRYIIMPTSCPINADLSPKTEENYKVFIDTAIEYGG